RTLRPSTLLDVTRRVRIEFRLAARRAEIVRLAAVLTLAGRFVLINLHLAHGISRHREPLKDLGSIQRESHQTNDSRMVCRAPPPVAEGCRRHSLRIQRS